MRDPHVFEFGEQFEPLPQEEPLPTAKDSDLSGLAAREAGILAKPAGLEPMSTSQLIRDLKRRLRYVEGEIKVRKQLEKERSQIQRLLKAAKQEQATVHAIKRAAG